MGTVLGLKPVEERLGAGLYAAHMNYHTKQSFLAP